MRFTDDVNKYINEKKPWKLEGDKVSCFPAMNGFRLFQTVDPILPNLTKSSLKLLMMTIFYLKVLKNQFWEQNKYI